jgi:hypothetical protein
MWTWVRIINGFMKGKKMTSLRHRVIAVVSALVILMAIVVLPGCKKSGPTTTKAPAKKKVPETGME